MQDLKRRTYYVPGGGADRREKLFEADLASMLREKLVRQLHLVWLDGGWNLYVLPTYRQLFMVVSMVRRDVRSYQSIDRLLTSLKQFGELPAITVVCS